MTQRTLSFPISGMHCAGCEAVISTAVKELPGVDMVSADHIAKKVQVRFDDALISPSTILACIESKGYSYGIPVEKVLWRPRLKQIAVFLVLLALVGGIAFWGKSLMPGLMKQFDARLGYGVIFTVGFLTGFHCIGMCGGFVMNYTQGVQGRRAVFFAHLSYALGKNISYALLGAVFGALGAVLTITPHMRGIAALVAGIFLVLFGNNAAAWKEGHPRNDVLAQIQEKGLATWKKESGYHHRSLAENAMYRLKQLFGDHLASRLFESQVVEVHARIAAMNVMTYLGMPVSVRVGATIA